MGSRHHPFTRRRLMIATAVIMAGAAAWAFWRPGSPTPKTLAETRAAHRTAYEKYQEYSKQYEVRDGEAKFGFTTCYGPEWDRYSERISDDVVRNTRNKAYLKSQVERYRRLSEEHRIAAESANPPAAPPPGSE